jgi:pilus assembly protein CpaF
MFAIIITEKGGEQRRMVFDKPEVTIGRVQGNDIVLPKGNVSKRHARIVLKDGKFIIVDLKSTNGTYVNGRKITSPLVIKDTDKIYIGDFIMGVDESGSGAGDLAMDPGSGPMPPAREPDPPKAPAGGSPELLGAALSRPPPVAPPSRVPPPPGGASFDGGDGGPPHPSQSARGPSRQMPAVAPPREPPPPMAREPLAPPPREREPALPPPAASPEARTRPPRPAPGGTLPPPSGSPSPGPNVIARQPDLPAPAPREPALPRDPGPPPPAPAPVAAPASVAAAPAAGTPRPRLVGAGARRIAPRPIAPPMQRGVKLEPLDAKVVRMLDLQTQILERLRAKLDLDNVPLERLGDEDLWQKAERAIVDLVETLDSSGELPKYIDQNTLIKETLNEALGLGPLEDLLADDKVDEIVVDRRDRILVGKDGALRGSGKAFSSDDVLERVVERLVAPTGREIGEATPVVDVRLRDGSRLTAAVPPVAVRGAYLTLRKPRTAAQTVSDLVGAGALSQAMADFLMTCVAARRNILVCGGPGSGKSAVIAALATISPDGERVVSVEEVSELALKRDEWLPLEARPADGKLPAIELPQLVRAALRMHPDRLVVGDVRGAEALELVSALGSSIDGAVASVMGEGAHAGLSRLATLAQLGAQVGADAEHAVREMVAGAFDVVVHVVRYADGHSRVLGIEEVLGTRDGGFDTQPIFGFKGGDEGFAATGAVPRFYADLESRGITADQSVFRA